MSIATHIPFHVLADYPDEILATYIDVLNQANEQAREGN